MVKKTELENTKEDKKTLTPKTKVAKESSTVEISQKKISTGIKKHETNTKKKPKSDVTDSTIITTKAIKSENEDINKNLKKEIEPSEKDSKASKVKNSTKKENITDNFKSRRKTSLSIIKSCKPSKNGKIIVNGIDFDKYFKIKYFKNVVLSPFKTLQDNKIDMSSAYFDFIISVNGGGFKGQAEALAQTIAKFLSSLNEDYKKILKQSGFLSTDMRNVERKVPGYRKSRKKEQFSKR